jgi:hypothetical protein
MLSPVGHVVTTTASRRNVAAFFRVVLRVCDCEIVLV